MLELHYPMIQFLINIYIYIYIYIGVHYRNHIWSTYQDTPIIRWPPRRVTALQVVRTSFLGPRPRLSNPPPPRLARVRDTRAKEAT